MTDEKKVYSVEEIAEMMGVTKITVYSWLKSGKLKGVKIGKYWKIKDTYLDDFLTADDGK